MQQSYQAKGECVSQGGRGWCLTLGIRGYGPYLVELVELGRCQHQPAGQLIRPSSGSTAWGSIQTAGYGHLVSDNWVCSNPTKPKVVSFAGTLHGAPSSSCRYHCFQSWDLQFGLQVSVCQHTIAVSLCCCVHTAAVHSFPPVTQCTTACS